MEHSHETKVQIEMDYHSIEDTSLKYPESNYESFEKTAKTCVDEFSNDNAIIALIDREELRLTHLHKLLNTLFHQVYMSSTSFALAGAMCDTRYFKIREYLLHHAEEEQDHWKWIIQNLNDTRFTGPDPREVFPSLATQSYISFAMFLAHKHPAARLAMGFVLEGLSGQLGVEYGQKAAIQLKLTREQMSFFVLHGELDKGHSQDILDVLKDAPLTPYEWAYCEYAAKCTVTLYRNMYNHATV
ncbi:MAG: iron-containing redox enzyme family protein [Mucilaginibacter sp.]